MTIGSMSQNIGIFVSENQIISLKAGNSFTTCEPKERLDSIKPSVISERLCSIGNTYDVADENGQIQTRAKLKDAFVMTFGALDSRFVDGMGFGGDIRKCKSSYEDFWNANFPKEKLTDATELFVTIWEPV